MTLIGHHGVVGDLETLALIGDNATVEWLCWPRFDSPSLFGRLLDPDGGSWSIRPVDEDARQRQLYLPETNMLVTRFHLDDGLVEVEDYMNVVGPDRALVRRVSCIRGRMTMESVMIPRPDYGRTQPKLGPDNGEGISISMGDDTLWLTCDVDEVEVEGDAITAAFSLAEGDSVAFALGHRSDGVDRTGQVDDNIAFWQAWIGQSTYTGRWREVVNRSALVLKLLTHRTSGGVLAAGTTSLPETLAGGRNWDYRYVWLRDAAFTLYAFIELGLTDEAEAFTQWLDARLTDCAFEAELGPLAPLYDLDGNRELPEQELEHWSGYRGAGPVRIGNEAAGQLQLDSYGELLDSLYLADKHGPGLSLGAWHTVQRLVDWVCANWDQPDDGMWEVRSGRQRFTSSALMCWVALERGIRMASFRGRPADLERWHRSRDEIHRAIMSKGWSHEAQAFTQTFDGDVVDASILLMPLVKFVTGIDPQWLSTLRAVEDQLAHGVLVDRYDNAAVDDGLEGDDGSFSICSFWYVEALVRAGRLEQARTLFEKMLTYAGPLGLFSEVISPGGEQLGNYPQAFTHLALISAAVHLNEALDQTSP